jgi:hypothetical protein
VFDSPILFYLFFNMAKIKPYQIAVPEAALTKLKQKLREVDFPEELEDAGWTYGTPLQAL